MEESTFAIVGNDTDAPRRYFDTFRRSEYLEPEKALLLAILPRPTDVLVGYDLVALIFAVGVAAFLIMAVRGWRRDDSAWLTALHDELGPQGRR